jgi:hypothetical protein
MRTTFLAVLAIAPACATDELGELTRDLDNAIIDEQMLCDQRACFLHRASDRDHDGIADRDEDELGTDPDRFLSRPTLADVFRVLPDLPTFQTGDSMMLMLPTFTPFGEEVFGGKALLPAKHSLLDDMGISLPEDGSIDLSDGFTLARDLYDAQGLAFSVPPWLAPTPQDPTSTTDVEDGAADVVGEVMKGHGPASNYKILSSSSFGDYHFGEISYTDSGNNDWTVATQTSPSYSTAIATSKHTLPSGRIDETRTIDSTQTRDEHGTVTTTTTTTKYMASDGTTSETKVVQTTAVSDDGHQKYYSNEKYKDGTKVSSESYECFDGDCFGTEAHPGTPVTDDIEEPGTAYQDPDYMEYTASPEVMDAVMVLHQGPVMTVNPLDADEGALYFTVTGANTAGGDTGDVALFTPDSYDTAITEPVIVHIPFQEDRAEGPPEEGPAPDDGHQGGQCLYCNQGGN